MEKLLLTTNEAAAALQVGRNKVYELMGSGRLLSVKIGGSRRVPAASLTAYVESLTALTLPAVTRPGAGRGSDAESTR